MRIYSQPDPKRPGEESIHTDYGVFRLVDMGHANNFIKRRDISEDSYSRNVYLYDQRGKLVWQVGAYEAGNPDASFVSMHIESERLFAINWDSHRYEIDVKTGKILSKAFTK